MCRKIEILDQNNKVLTGDADQDLIPEVSVVRFRCFGKLESSENLDSLIERFDFAVLEPSGEVVFLEERMSVANTSEDYLIKEGGDFIAECRLCTALDTCQEWTNPVIKEASLE
jgi:hypothetical protein